MVKAMSRQWNPRWHGSNGSGSEALLSSSAPVATDTKEVDASAVDEPNYAPAEGYDAPTTASKEVKEAPKEPRQLWKSTFCRNSFKPYYYNQSVAVG